MAKLTLTDLASTAAGSILTAVNNNNTAIETAIENTLSRDGTSPNEMNADLDMNSQRIYNLPQAADDTEPVRLIEFNEWVDAMDAAVATAQAAATSAEDAWDSFDDRYLGAKAVEPSVDNDGDALIVGALYFNSSTDIMYVWTGATWDATTGGGGGSGDVTGPVSSVDGEIALFNGASGDELKSATGTGVAIITSGVLSAKTNPTGAFVGTSDTQTLTNKSIDLASNTITGTTAQFNTALSDDDFATTTSLAAYAQPLDDDLTSIAALSTTAYGRSLLTLADDDALFAEFSDLGTVTWGAGSDFTWTFNGTGAGTNDPSFTFGNGSFTTSIGGDDVFRVRHTVVDVRGDTTDTPRIQVGLLTDSAARINFGLDASDAPAFGMGAGGASARDAFVSRGGAGIIEIGSTHGAIDGALHTATIELGHVSDTTLSRVSAGVVAIEGVNILTTATGQPLDADLTAIAALTTTTAGLTTLTVSDDALDELLVWDDSASTMKTMPLADFTTEGAPAAGDYLIIYGAEGDVRKVDWGNLPGIGGGLSNVSEDTSPTLGGDLEGGNFSIGTAASPTGNIFLGTGDKIDFFNGDITLTHSAEVLTLAGGTFVLPAAGLTMGASTPFSDAAGTLTLQNVDALDATTEATIEAAIDTLANLTSVQGLTITLADAGADAILGWDDSTGEYKNLSAADVRTAISGQAQDELLDEIAALSTDPNADSGLFFDDSAGAIAYFTPSNSLEFSGTNLRMTDNARLGTITFIIDGGGSAITTGIKGDLEIPFACTINQATALADQSGSIVVDIWKDTYANYPPTDADSITAAAPVTITTATKSQDATLTGWTTSIAAGDTLRFNVDSITTCTRVTISLRIIKT